MNKREATLFTGSLNGEISDILYDGLNLIPEADHTELFDLVEASSHSKTERLIEQLADRGFAVHWDLLLRDNQGASIYLVSALENQGEYTFMISSGHEQDRILSEMSQINNELAGLQRDLSRKHSQLEKANRELEQSNKDLQNFAYAISHDFREPLRMVRQFMNLLQEKYGPQLNQEANEYIDFAVDGAQRMESMIQGVLTFSRVETRGSSFSRVDSNEIVKQVLRGLHAQIQNSGAEIEVKDLPTISADETQIQMVFQNLISNAIKYSGDTPPRIVVSCQEHDEYHQFAVEDNGIGIDEEDRERIFQMFGRLHTSEEVEGTGIGLATVKRIIDRHDGNIWVESASDGGSIFYFTIPKD